MSYHVYNEATNIGGKGTVVMPNIYHSFSLMSKEEHTSSENMPCQLVCLSWQLHGVAGCR